MDAPPGRVVVTIEEAQAIVATLEPKGMLAQLGLEVRALRRSGLGPAGYALELEASVVVLDREAREGRPVARVQQREAFHDLVLASFTRADLLERVRGVVEELLAHELDEGLVFAGERTFDPHRAEARAPGRRAWHPCSRGPGGPKRSPYCLQDEVERPWEGLDRGPRPKGLPAGASSASRGDLGPGVSPSWAPARASA